MKIRGLIEIFAGYKGEKFRWLAILNEKLTPLDNTTIVDKRWIVGNKIIGETIGDKNLEGVMLIFRV